MVICPYLHSVYCDDMFAYGIFVPLYTNPLGDNNEHIDEPLVTHLVLHNHQVEDNIQSGIIIGYLWKETTQALQELGFQRQIVSRP